MRNPAWQVRHPGEDYSGSIEELMPSPLDTNSNLNTIRVAIVEDDGGLQSGLVILLNAAEGMTCVGAFSSAEDFLRNLSKIKADVLVVDINLPGISGIELVEKVKTLMPDAEVLILTMYEDGDLIFRALQAGASGYLLKRVPPAKLVAAIREVAIGGAPMSPSVARRIVQQFQPAVSRCPEIALLTGRERETLELLSKGQLYKEIGDQLGISIDTVRSHIRKIYEKLRVQSRAEASLKFRGL